jgi:hypothetical protein
VSLSQDPAYSVLRDYFVCGVRDISNQPYAGVSGAHEVGGKAIKTTNGAGPHNLQTFVLASDGTVLHCLPGYWNPTDLVGELQFASQLNDIWNDPHLSRLQKDQMFRQAHLAHINEHPRMMVARSKMQSFDQKFEAKQRLYTSDTILDKQLAQASLVQGQPVIQQAFKTTDVIMHERMAKRPFLPYERFDVAMYSDYGRQKYEKHEDYRYANGKVDVAAARDEQLIGNTAAMPQKHNRNRGMNARRMNRLMRQGVTFLR